MDQYMALSKKDLVINITLNELYNTHSLILQHVETLVNHSIVTYSPPALVSHSYISSHRTTSSICGY